MCQYNRLIIQNIIIVHIDESVFIERWYNGW